MIALTVERLVSLLKVIQSLVNFPRSRNRGVSWAALFGLCGPARAARMDPTLFPAKGGWNPYHPNELIFLSALSAQHLMS